MSVSTTPTDGMTLARPLPRVRSCPFVSVRVCLWQTGDAPAPQNSFESPGGLYENFSFKLVDKFRTAVEMYRQIPGLAIYIGIPVLVHDLSMSDIPPNRAGRQLKLLSHVIYHVDLSPVLGHERQEAFLDTLPPKIYIGSD